MDTYHLARQMHACEIYVRIFQNLNYATLLFMAKMYIYLPLIPTVAMTAHWSSPCSAHSLLCIVYCFVHFSIAMAFQ